jgi:hypothetical protein
MAKESMKARERNAEKVKLDMQKTLTEDASFEVN